MMIKRPGRGETEEDLLKFQEDFLKQPQKSSVTFSSKSKEKKNEKRFVICEDELHNAQHRLDNKGKEHISEILTSIQEKPSLSFPQAPTLLYQGGFPQAPNIASLLNKHAPTSTGKKKSLFAQNFGNMDPNKDLGRTSGLKIPAPVQKDIVGNQATSVSCSRSINKGDGKHIKEDSIHNENMEKLNQMSEKEIIEEQQRLFSTMDPKLIEFLKSKKPTNKQDVIQPSNVKIEKQQQPQQQQQQLVDDAMDPFVKFGISKDYVKMNEVEKEKLSWMKDVPRVEMMEKGVALPRFDFDGHLLASGDTDQPASHTGLYHHGDQPHLPGYTLEELFRMARSNFPQQRVFALQTLGKITKQHHLGSFSGKLSTDLLQQCVEAGLLFIIRWSLDEHTEQIYSAAISLLANILYVQRDQDYFVDSMYTCCGVRQVQLCTYYKKREEEMTQEEREENRDNTDAELVKLDVVKGLLQMQILPRLRYLMEVRQPSSCAMLNCVAVVTRIAQHDVESAWQLVRCPHLVNVLIALLQGNVAMGDERVAMGDERVAMGGEENATSLSARILTLLTAMCQSGKELAKKMVAEFSLEEIISKFVSQMGVSNDMVLSRAYQLWRVLLSYTLTPNLFVDLHSLTMSQSHKVCMKAPAKNNNPAKDCNNAEERLAASIVYVVEGGVVCSTAQQFKWDVVNSFYPVLVQCAETCHDRQVERPLFTTAVLQCLATFLRVKNQRVTEENPVSLIDSAQKVWSEVCLPTISSAAFNITIANLNSCTSLKIDVQSNAPSSLPSYGMSSLGDGTSLLGDCTSLLGDGTSLLGDFSLVHSVFGLVLEVVKISKGLANKVVPFLASSSLLAYMQQIPNSNFIKLSNDLAATQVESMMITTILQLFITTAKICGFDKFEQNTLDAILNLSSASIMFQHHHDNRIVLLILKHVLFNPFFYRAHSDEGNQLVATTVKTAIEELQQISDVYLATFMLRSEEEVDTTFFYKRVNILPADWMFLPIVKLYNHSLSLEHEGGVILQASIDTFNLVQRCLQYILLLEQSCQQLLHSVKLLFRFTRLVCLFLIEGCVYNDKKTDAILNSLFTVTSPHFQAKLDFEADIPGVTSFYDMYTNLLSQYLSSSFGNYTFANLVLIPLQLKHHPKYRRTLWTEHKEILRMFPLPIQQIKFGVENFLAVEMENENMIDIYFDALLADKVRPTWCPVFYLVAIHHVNQFLFHKNQSEKGKAMLKEILKMKNKETREDVLFYDRPCLSIPKGFVLFKQLPQSRDHVIKSVVT